MIDHVEQIVLEKHKLLVTKFVLPVMGVVSIFICTYYFSPTTPVVAVIILGACTAAFNIFLTTGYLRVKFRNIHLKKRSETVDLVRWIFNIAVTDTLLAVTLPMSFEEFVNFWFFLSVCSFADNFARKFRLFISGICFVLFFSIAYFHFHENHLLKNLFLAFGIFSFLFIFSKLEKYWVESLKDLVDSEQAKAEIVLESEKMRIDAVLGMQSRHISHELGNMIMVIDASVHLMKKSLSLENQAVLARLAQLEKAINYIRKINHLVIDSIRFKAEIRTVAVAEFFEDIEILFGKDLTSKGIQWRSELDETLISYEFQERSGSLFLIMQNILKNSNESMQNSLDKELRENSCLSFVISRVADQNFMQIHIKDNGCGMEEHILQKILRGQMVSDKKNGHGLGLSFVHSECGKNKIELSGTSYVGVGSEFFLKVPIKEIEAKRVS